MSSLAKKPTKRIFNSIEAINAIYEVNLKSPTTIPDGTNLLCYKVVDLHCVELLMYLKETSCELLYYVDGVWDYSGSGSIEEEVKWDSAFCRGSYIYLRVAQKEDKDKFTPERLLGVETNTGFITSVEERFYMGYQARVTTTKGFSYFMETLEYYVSDVSDETVSFEEYVRIFYEE